MALADNATLAIDATFRNKVRAAALNAALAVVGETPSGNGIRDERRYTLGMLVLVDGGAAKLDAFAWAVASFGTITGASTDSDIQFVVNSIWNDLAGIK